MGAHAGTVAQGSTLLHFTRNGNFGPGGAELLVVERGEGAYVFDTHGNRYVDGLSSLFCAQIGYSYGEEMGAVAAEQLQQLAFSTIWGTAHPPALELADRLAGLAPDGIDRVFFTSGGSEAVEAAWKLARQYHIANGEPQRLKAIARNIAYHGVTLGALSLHRGPGVQGAVRPARDLHAPRLQHQRLPLRASRVRSSPPSCSREIEAVILEEGPETIGVIIAEPVQNAGGCLVPPPGYWQGLRELADRYGILLHADEVITGFGRLGEYFGVTRFDATPDLITVAKGLTSAYAPMGAVLVSEKVAAPFYEDRSHADARHHLRRPPAVRRDRAQEPRDLRARAGARERPRT